MFECGEVMEVNEKLKQFIEEWSYEMENFDKEVSFKVEDKVCFTICDYLPEHYGSVYEVKGWNWKRDCIVLLDVKDRKGDLRFVSEDVIRKASWNEIINSKRGE